MTQQQNQLNANVLYGVIIALLVVIAILGFFLGKMSATPSEGAPVATQNTDLKMTVIDDQRCKNCETDQILSQLKQIPAVANAVIENKDFSDAGVEKYLQENNIQVLPAVIFNSGYVDMGLNQYLSELASGEFSLALGATFNPFLERSERGFLLLDTQKLQEIKQSAYIKGNPDAQITWLEYSDIECPYCAKLHNDGTPDTLSQVYGDKLNIMFQHFPLDFHANAQVGAEILECLGEQQGSEAFYTVIEQSFSDKDSSKSYLLEKAAEAGADSQALEACLDSNKYTDKVQQQMKTGAETFGVTGTPGNVLINNQTGEYGVLSGAYPADSFQEIIDDLLQ